MVAFSADTDRQGFRSPMKKKSHVCLAITHRLPCMLLSTVQLYSRFHNDLIQKGQMVGLWCFNSPVAWFQTPYDCRLHTEIMVILMMPVNSIRFIPHRPPARRTRPDRMYQGDTQPL